MKTLLLLLLLALSPFAFANGQSSSSSSSTLQAISRLIQEQKVALTDALNARNQAEADRKAALDQVTQARTEVAVQAERIAALVENRDQWEARAEWYRKDNDKLQKIKEKYDVLNSRINWVALSLGVMTGLLASALVIFYSGGTAFAVPAVVAAVGAGSGIAVFGAIQAVFRLV